MDDPIRWQEEIERAAEAIYREAGLDPWRCTTAEKLVLALFKTRIRRPAKIRGEATTGTMYGKRLIAVRSGIRRARMQWLVMHEIAHWWYRRLGYVGPDIQARCNALGAALIAPRPTWIAAKPIVGSDIKAAAEMFGTTQSLALLRYGECDLVPVVLVESTHIIARGAFASSEFELMRSLVRGGGARRIQITDEPDRYGLMAA